MSISVIEVSNAFTVFGKSRKILNCRPKQDEYAVIKTSFIWLTAVAVC